MNIVRNFKEHDRASRSLLLYGYGDGGGGPTIEMLEKARRMRDFDGLPKLTLERRCISLKRPPTMRRTFRSG